MFSNPLLIVKKKVTLRNNLIIFLFKYFTDERSLQASVKNKYVIYKGEKGILVLEY